MDEKKNIHIPTNQTEDVIQMATANDLLVKAQWPHLAINEQRLVLYMLSLIKRSDKDFKTYRISIRELANILGLKRKDLYKEFDKATSGLMTKIIKWIDTSTRHKKYISVSWCSYAARIPGGGYVEMRFDPSLKPFLLSLQGNFTIWGDRRSVIRLKSHYSLRLYQFIKYNQGLAAVDGRRSAKVKLSWLRTYLAISEDKYRLFGHFKSRILLPAQKDIKAKTDIEFDFKQIKKGRRVHELEFFWKKNKDYNQLELPGMSDKAPARLEDILKLEFGITPKKKIDDLIRKYGHEHIIQALERAREYIEGVRSQGKKVGNTAGIAVKAIEEGWKQQKPLIDIKHEEKLKALAKAKEAEVAQKEAKRAQEERKREKAMLYYESMNNSQKEAFLSDFRDSLIATGNRIVVERFDKKGITPGPIEALFKSFLMDLIDN